VRKRLLILLGSLFAFFGLCSFCLWGMKERPRFDYKFDAGMGRMIRVWSIRRDEWFVGPNPLMVYYRIDQNGTELVHTTFMNHDDGGEYQFKALIAERGQLVCVYEVSRGSKDEFMTILYDATSGESWPRDNANWYFYPEIKRKWRERFERVQREYPDYQMPRDLLK
jgi:hypothetical protein